MPEPNYHPDSGSRSSGQRLMTIDEVRDRLRVSRWSVYQLINNRQLKTITIGTRRLVAPEDFEALVRGLRHEETTNGR